MIEFDHNLDLRYHTKILPFRNFWIIQHNPKIPQPNNVFLYLTLSVSRNAVSMLDNLPQIVLGGALCFSHYPNKTLFYDEDFQSRDSPTKYDRPNNPFISKLIKVDGDFPKLLFVGNEKNKSYRILEIENILSEFSYDTNTILLIQKNKFLIIDNPLL